MHILADFIFGSDEELSGIFVYEQGGVLSVLKFTVWLATHPKPCRRPILSSRFPMRPLCLTTGEFAT
jgi:hypothetical protein